MIVDLEMLVAQVWSPEVRPLVDEAWRCYNAGAIRSSIAATWSAVSVDIIVKLVRLADDGDVHAQIFRKSVTDAQDHGLTSSGVTAMQKIEGELLSKAVDFELVDTIGKRDLERIREDRHLCVHPSLRTGGEVYIPRSETARAHLALALSTLLTHPPTQGRRLIEEFKKLICDPLFASSSSHIQATFYSRVQAATRGNIIKLAAKFALLELDPDGQMPADAHADRMAFALNAFADVDRDAVHDAVGKNRDRLRTLDNAVQLRTLVRMADNDYFWDWVDTPLVDHFTALLNRLASEQGWDPLQPDVASYLAVVGSDYARERLPTLSDRFDALNDTHQQQVAAVRPSAYFVPKVIRLLEQAGNWRTGEKVGRLLVQHAEFLTLHTLEAALEAWFSNINCREASGMPFIAVELVHATAHLGIARGHVFKSFVQKCRSTSTASDHYYSYPDLQVALSKIESNRLS